MDKPNFDYILKYIIVGDGTVGKSSLLLRFTKSGFNQEYEMTLNVDFGVKNIKIRNKIYRIQIFDTAGQENLRSIARMYYKNSICAIVVYDITRRDTFNNVSIWIEDCKNQCPKSIFMVLVGNKLDLAERRQISSDEGRELAEKNGMLFFETSAKDGTNVENIFVEAADNIANNIDNNYYDLDEEYCGIIKEGYCRANSITSQMSCDYYRKGKKKKKCCKY